MTTAGKPEGWDGWTYYDKEEMCLKLKEGARGKVPREWKQLQSIMDYEN